MGGRESRLEGRRERGIEGAREPGSQGARDRTGAWEGSHTQEEGERARMGEVRKVWGGNVTQFLRARGFPRSPL